MNLLPTKHHGPPESVDRLEADLKGEGGTEVGGPADFGPPGVEGVAGLKEMLQFGSPGV